MKKFAILVGILVVVVVVFVNPITSFLIESGLDNREQQWAPTLVFGGARMKMRIMQYDDAIAAFKQGIALFSNHKNMPKIYFWTALSYEKTGNAEGAHQWYSQYLDRWPHHMWAAQARNRLARLDVTAASD